MSARHILLILMLSPIFSSTGSAQIVDVQSRLSGAPAEGIRGETALSGEWRTGNTDSFTFAADLSIERTRGRNQSFLIVASELGRASGASYANRHFAHLRHRFHLGERWAVEGFLQSEFDEFKRLELRALAGVGVRAVVAKSRGAGLALGAALMGELEEIASDGARSAADLHHRTPRLSSYVSGSIQLAPGWNVSTTSYAQPALDDIGDLRLSSHTSITVRPGDRVALELTATLDRDARPPEGVKPLDAALRQGITLSF